MLYGYKLGAGDGRGADVTGEPAVSGKSLEDAGAVTPTGGVATTGKDAGDANNETADATANGGANGVNQGTALAEQGSEVAELSAVSPQQLTRFTLNQGTRGDFTLVVENLEGDFEHGYKWYIDHLAKDPTFEKSTKISSIETKAKDKTGNDVNVVISLKFVNDGRIANASKASARAGSRYGASAGGLAGFVAGLAVGAATGPGMFVTGGIGAAGGSATGAAVGATTGSIKELASRNFGISIDGGEFKNSTDQISA